MFRAFRRAAGSFRQQRTGFFNFSRSPGAAPSGLTFLPQPLRRPQCGHRTAVLKAEVFGRVLTGIVVLALARPLDEEVPDYKSAEYQAAWQSVFASQSRAKARELVWRMAQEYLAHTFRGSIVDEGPFGADIFIAAGAYIAAKDTKLFWLPIPEGEPAMMPVVCVAINARSHVPANQNYPDEDDVAYQMAQLTQIIHQVGPRLLQWREEGRFKEKCFVILRFVDRTAYFVAEGEHLDTFRLCPLSRVTSNSQAAADVVISDGY